MAGFELRRVDAYMNDVIRSESMFRFQFQPVSVTRHLIWELRPRSGDVYILLRRRIGVEDETRGIYLDGWRLCYCDC